MEAKAELKATEQDASQLDYTVSQCEIFSVHLAFSSHPSNVKIPFSFLLQQGIVVMVAGMKDEA